MITKTENLEARIAFGNIEEVQKAINKLRIYYKIENRKYAIFIVYEPNLDKLIIEMYSIRVLKDEKEV